MDRRTKRQKLEAMANQDVSPHEAEVAKEKLKALKPAPPEPTMSVKVNGITFNFVSEPDPGVGVWDSSTNSWKWFRPEE